MRNRRHALGPFLSCVAIAVLSSSFLAAAQERGIQGRKAPSWGVEQWINLPENKDTLDIDDYRGKVLYLYCFQSWCPGCHKHGFPTLKEMIGRFEDDEDVAFVAVQTVFEGFHTNTFERAKEVAERYELEIPVGHSGEDGQRSELMTRYRTGGTPWVVIIDKEGVVRFDGFHVRTDPAERFIRKLADAPGTERHSRLPGRRQGIGFANAPQETPVPVPAAGADVVGKKLPLDDLTWVAPEEGPPSLEGKVTLVRWWTDTCPFCAASLPAIEKLEEQFGGRGLQTVGVYHPKPPRPMKDQTVRTAAKDFGYSGYLARDNDWSVLEDVYLDTGDRPATSAAFLLDEEGVIRYVHPGPSLHPAEGAGDAPVQRAYDRLVDAVEALLRRLDRQTEA